MTMSNAKVLSSMQSDEEPANQRLQPDMPSPSAAAASITGNMVNGWILWE